MVLKPAEFLVETVEAGLGEVLVYVEDPEGHTEEVGARLISTPYGEIELKCLLSFRPE